MLLPVLTWLGICTENKFILHFWTNLMTRILLLHAFKSWHTMLNTAIISSLLLPTLSKVLSIMQCRKDTNKIRWYLKKNLLRHRSVGLQVYSRKRRTDEITNENIWLFWESNLGTLQLKSGTLPLSYPGQYPQSI